MYIYIITNMVNNKIYIGQTITTIEQRFKEHCRPSKNSTLIDKAINKYGKENFKVEFLCETNSLDELNKLEIFYIKEYNAMDRNVGYNLCIGGNNTKGYRHRKDSREKMSKFRMGIFAGNKNPFYGKHHSDETKKKLSDLHKGKKLSEEHKAHLRMTSPNKVSVICTTTGESFESVSDAARKYNIEVTHISRVCKGKRKSCKGYTFVYGNTVPSPSDDGKV